MWILLRTEEDDRYKYYMVGLTKPFSDYIKGELSAYCWTIAPNKLSCYQLINKFPNRPTIEQVGHGVCEWFEAPKIRMKWYSCTVKAWEIMSPNIIEISFLIKGLDIYGGKYAYCEEFLSSKINASGIMKNMGYSGPSYVTTHDQKPVGEAYKNYRVIE